MRKILTSLGMVVFAGAVVVGATGAFFSDTETSTGNVFAAGDIDLQIDNTSYVTNEAGVLVASPETSWSLKDLVPGVDHFFDFEDVKPGDIGEDTISLHPGSNDAWMCAAAQITADLDNDITDPEDEVGGPAGSDGTVDGDLDSGLNFAFWNDDGDNVLETGENIFLSGPLSGLGAAGQIRLADSTGNIWGPGTAPVEGDSTVYIGKAWCYGTLTPNPQAPGAGNPLVETGIDCDGSGVGNIGQTDSVEGDLQFYATQSRNNSTFTCEEYDPTFPDTLPDEELVGAALGDYVAPACNVTVTDGNSIQAVIDANGPGSTICVGPGTHDSDTYPLRVNEDNMSLVSTAGAATTILNGGVILDNDGTKVMGFTIPNSTALSETFGVYINTGADGVTVSFNDMNGPGVGSGRGVVNAIGTTNALIANNEISNYLTGVFMNPSSGMIVEKNDLVSNGVGSGNDNPTGNTIRNNHITGNTIEGVGVLSVGAESIEVNFNNIFGNGGAANELNSYAVDAVDAEDNWWGDITPADEIGGPGAASVDFTPFAAAVYAQN